MYDPRQDNSKPVALVVDDDPVLRTLVAECLEQDGFKVVQAADGQAGVRCFEEVRPDIVLMDVLMPGMDGFTAVSFANCPPVPTRRFS